MKPAMLPPKFNSSLRITLRRSFNTSIAGAFFATSG
jgi:hypothetical protein